MSAALVPGQVHPDAPLHNGWLRDEELLLARSHGKRRAPVSSAASCAWNGIRGFRGNNRSEARESCGGHRREFGVSCVLPICQELCFLPVQLVLFFALEPLVWLRGHTRQRGSSLDETKS